MEDEELALAEKNKGDLKSDRAYKRKKDFNQDELSHGGDLKMSKSKTSAPLERNPIRAASMNLTSQGISSVVSGGSILSAKALTSTLKSSSSSNKGASVVKSKGMSIGNEGDLYNSSSTVKISDNKISKTKKKNVLGGLFTKNKTVIYTRNN
tara:strand:- start:723 stop:1178 length:456 start_codon:yes stop_codon:yes gene_type:complete